MLDDVARFSITGGILCGDDSLSRGNTDTPIPFLRPGPGLRVGVGLEVGLIGGAAGMPLFWGEPALDMSLASRGGFCCCIAACWCWCCGDLLLSSGRRAPGVRCESCMAAGAAATLLPLTRER